MTNDRIEGLKSIYFEEIKYFYRSGFNILLYGVGSKVEIVKHLVEEIRAGMGVLTAVINGYHPGSTLKMVLNGLTLQINSCLKDK